MRSHPYISSSIITTILAVIVWFLVPKEYAATTKLSDECKETDIAIGLNSFTADLKKQLGSSNNNMNDIEVYCKTLKTTDFAKEIASKQIPVKHLTYGQWLMSKRYFWQTNDTIAAVSDNIEYNISSKQETLTIQFTDRDAVVASQMLDSVTSQLQTIVTKSRQLVAEAAMKNAEKNRADAEERYHKAINQYADYCDSHKKATLKETLQHEAQLKNEVTLAFDEYDEATNQYARQLALMQRDLSSFAVIKSNHVPITSTASLWVYIFSFILIGLVSVKGYKLFLQRKAEHVSIDLGGVFSPWAITLFVWGGMGLMFLITGDILDPLTDQFYRSISLWIPIFVITSILTFNLLKHDSKPFPQQGIEINNYIFYFFFFIAVVLSPMYMYKVYQLVSMFDSKDMMKNMRDLAVYGDGQGLLNYAIVIAQSLFLVSVWRYPKIPLWQLILIVFCCLLNSIAIMEKGSTFLVLLCGMYVLFERGVIKIRTIAVLCVLTVFGFYFFNLMREGEDSTYAKNESLLDFIGMYVMSPPVAYCHVREELATQVGTNTLQTIYLFLDRFGIGHFDVHQKTQEFVYVPVSTNVYTIMQPFFRDFGYLGVAFFSWIYGMISGVLYRYSCNGNVLCICLYTYMVEVLVLQFYQENLFMSMVFILQLVFFVFLFTQKKFRLEISS